MSSVSQSAAATAPPARHGTAGLRVRINADVYSLTIKHPSGGVKVWILRKLTGERSGSLYAVTRHKGYNDCTCPDSSNRGSVCKHERALVAVGLLSSRKLRPSEGGVK